MVLYWVLFAAGASGVGAIVSATFARRALLPIRNEPQGKIRTWPRLLKLRTLSTLGGIGGVLCALGLVTLVPTGTSPSPSLGGSSVGPTVGDSMAPSPPRAIVTPPNNGLGGVGGDVLPSPLGGVVGSAGGSQPPTFTFKFDEPVEYASVSDGFRLSGTTPNIGADSLWLTDYAYHSNYTQKVYYRDAPTPISVQDGHWSTNDGQLGSPSDIGATFTIVVVRANPSCSAKIAGINPNPDGAVVIGIILPPGCAPMGTIHVVKKA